jgi:leucyl-tRNA synthetase
MEYNFLEIEKRWKQYWKENNSYKVDNKSNKPKCYVLDMFPYPSGAGLHVGHPLGYIASDIYARYKRQRGYNVLHPMGYDAFGLPAEQYAIETGQHPAHTTDINISRYREQLDNIGFCYDWSREVRTSDPRYYKWTQWIFLQLFHSWFDRTLQKARPIDELIEIFRSSGNEQHRCPADAGCSFSAMGWNAFSEKERREILMKYRLAYLGHAQVWWCEALGTVLANDEVVNGVSERGGYPVERKMMRQWFLRITEYADRLLAGLDTLEWTDAMKDMQRNWIGKSSGASVRFDVDGHAGTNITVFTTRPDTIFGVDFLVLAPEHDLLTAIVTKDAADGVEQYRSYVKSRSERERMSEVKQITGCFTGAYAIHPFTGGRVPVWTSEYVLISYGTGAIMAVPSGDDRDHAFAKNFAIPITNIFGDNYTGESAWTEKSGVLYNSDFVTGMSVSEAAEVVIAELEAIGAGSGKVNYRLRDAGYSRQRYWGEPFPVVYDTEGVVFGVDEDFVKKHNGLGELPVTLPYVGTYSPGPNGQGPLANVTEWVNTPAGMRETSTMPGYAGSSWYFLRYMDPGNDVEFAGRAATDYWQQVDLYIGGTEHAVGHLLYSRMWTKVLHDLGHIGFDEPFRKLVNQGMIQGSSRLVYRINNTNTFVTAEHRKEYEVTPLHVDVNIVNGFTLDVNAFKQWRSEYSDAEFILNEQGTFTCGTEVEKMSKRYYNVVNPDVIVAQYGADTFRMYEMFLGPIEVSKPWDTKGIEGVNRFLRKLWRLFADEKTGWCVTNDAPVADEWRSLHKSIKKISDDIERFSFNTAVSQFMICVNELTALGCHKRTILEPLAVMLASFAPHIAEELWQVGLGKQGSVLDAEFPAYDESLIAATNVTYPVMVNGKKRAELSFAADVEQAAVEHAVIADTAVQKWLGGNVPKKIIFVKGKMVNIVV